MQLLFTIHTWLAERSRSDRGQSTAEYALLLLGAAAIALLVVTWAARSGKVGTLLNKVFDSVIGQIT